jgi:hypothetical protein
MKETLEDLKRAVASDGPKLSDAWEVTAMIESLGFNDLQVEHEFGFENTYAAGQYLYEQLRDEGESSDQSPPTPPVGCVEKFFSSFAYSIPWIVVLFFEWIRPQAFEISPDVAGPLSLALMGSLITSGGFIQVIARRGRFYSGLKEPFLARRICSYFLWIGLIASFLFCVVALFLGAYFNLFPAKGLFIAAAHYLLLSMLWMICAVLATQGTDWRIPVVFVAGGVVFAILKGPLGAGVLAAQTMAVAAALAAAATLAAYGFRSEIGAKAAKDQEMELPRVPVLIHSLTPYFVYGVAYFSFLFADRIAAGTAISWFSGLSFGIESGYAQGMNLALLNFLVTAALVEALTYRFMGGWYELASHQPNGQTCLKQVLRHRYAVYTVSIGAIFVAFSAAIYLPLASRWPVPNARLTMTTMCLGSLGYLLLAAAFFNAVILFSLNRPFDVLPSILQGVLADFLVGYTLSHLLGTYFAVVGLVLGAAIFTFGSSRAVLRALARPDYTYFAA